MGGSFKFVGELRYKSRKRVSQALDAFEDFYLSCESYRPLFGPYWLKRQRNTLFIDLPVDGPYSAFDPTYEALDAAAYYASSGAVRCYVDGSLEITVTANSRVPQSSNPSVVWDMLDAAYRNNTERLKKLIREGADPNQTTRVGHLTPLRYAVEGNALDALQLLLNEGAESSPQLFRVCCTVDAARALVESGANPSEATTEYYHLCYEQREDVLLYLMDYQFPVVLDVAKRTNNDRVVDYILAERARLALLGEDSVE